MKKKFLKSKLHGPRVTQANVNYRGSLTVDKDLIEAAGLKVFEMIKVINVENGERFETYIIEGERGSGIIGLNGGAAKKGNVGDRLIVFSSMWGKVGETGKVKVVLIDDENKVDEIREKEITF
ncbi:MAG: aspartate 1-decarboxylase [Elusimicrobiota bacterium]